MGFFYQNIVHINDKEQPTSNNTYFYMDHPYVENYNPLSNPIVDQTTIESIEVLKCGTIRKVGIINIKYLFRYVKISRT